jgi:hypothetical protein
LYILWDLANTEKMERCRSVFNLVELKDNGERDVDGKIQQFLFNAKWEISQSII